MKPNVLLIAAVSALMPLGAMAQSDSATDRAQFFVSQRVWLADWSIATVDSKIIPPSASQPTPVLRTSASNVSASRAVPLTGFGVSVDRWTLSATVGWSTEFHDARIEGGKVSRTEYDVNLGYAVTPNISTVLIYKAGKSEVPAIAGSPGAARFRDQQRLRGVGLGLSARFPVAENLSAYGSAAYSPGRSKFDSGERYNFRYTVAEAGLAYRIPAAFGMSVTAGYRYQNLNFRRGPVYNIALTPAPVELARGTERIKSPTKGFTMGVAFSF